MKTFQDVLKGLLSSFLLLAACGPTMLQIPIRKPAEIDVEGIRKIAIVDFQGPNGSGALASSLLTTNLLSDRFYQIFERTKIDQILEEHKLAMAGIVDENSARKVGLLLGADALIFGQVVTYKFDPDELGVEKVEKQVGTGKYRIVTRGKKKVREEIKKTVLADQSYIIRRGSASITVRMVNVESGQLVASKAISKSYDSGKVVEGRKKLKAKGAILHDMLAEIMKEFAQIISPHIVLEKLPFEKGKGPLKVGVQYAKNGLWEEAIKAFYTSVKQQPANASAHYNFGLANMVVGKFSLAEEEFKKAIVLKNKSIYFSALSRVKKFREDQNRLQNQVGGMQ